MTNLVVEGQSDTEAAKAVARAAGQARRSLTETRLALYMFTTSTPLRLIIGMSKRPRNRAIACVERSIISENCRNKVQLNGAVAAR